MVANILMDLELRFHVQGINLVQPEFFTVYYSMKETCIGKVFVWRKQTKLLFEKISFLWLWAVVVVVVVVNVVPLGTLLRANK